MKLFSVATLLGITVAFSGCARPFNPQLEAYPTERTASNMHITASVGERSIDRNGRYSKNADEEGYAVYGLSIEASGGENVSVAYSHVTANLDARNVEPTLLTTFYQATRQNAPIYFLYALINGFYSQCDDSDCSTYWVPIGIVPALFNYARANNANKKYRSNLESNIFKSGDIPANSSRSGLVLFRLWESAQVSTIDIRYRVSGTEHILQVPIN